MTYLAPRQGLFAIIILISFFIQTTLLLISTNQQLDELKMQTGERMLVQLIEEVKLPLLSKDKVSLSVLTGRYTSEKNVASLTVKDIDGEILLQTGQAQLLEGDSISREVVLSDTVIGEVVMTLRDNSNGEIIASQWIFILGSLITHLMIWLIYGYIARPTRAQLAALSRDVQDYIRQNQSWSEPENRTSSQSFDESSHEFEEFEENASAGKLNVTQALNKFIKSNQHADDPHAEHYNDGESEDHSDRISTSSIGSDSNNLRIDSGSASGNMNTSGIDDSAQGLVSNEINSRTSSNRPNLTNASSSDMDGTSATTHTGTIKKSGLVSNRPLKVACVQIKFYDPNNLLSTLAFEKSKPYFALCTQLLERTIDEMLKQPLLFGIEVLNQPAFDENGATVELSSSSTSGFSSGNNKVGLAAMMLAKSFVMLNEVTFIKHRELQRFALEVMVGVSDIATTDKMEQLLRNNAKANDILTLLPSEGIKQLGGYIQLDNLNNPTTVYERDCATLKGVSDSMMQRLTQVRNAVLLSAID